MKLFDTENSEYDAGLAIGPLWARNVNSSDPRQGYERAVGELRFGSGVHARASIFSAGGTLDFTIRALDRSMYSFSYVHQALLRLRLGPLQPEVFFGFSVFTADNFQHRLSVGLFSPRVGFGGSIRLGKLMLGAHAHSEYQWRFRGDDYSLRGVLLSLRFVTPTPSVPTQESPLGGDGAGFFGR